MNRFFLALFSSLACAPLLTMQEIQNLAEEEKKSTTVIPSLFQLATDLLATAFIAGRISPDALGNLTGESKKSACDAIASYVHSRNIITNFLRSESHNSNDWSRQAIRVHWFATQVYTVSWSPDGKQIASGSLDGSIDLFDTERNFLGKFKNIPQRGIMSLHWAPCGTKIVAGSRDQNVYVLDVKTLQILLTLRGHTEWVRSVKFSPDGTKIASASADLTIRIWDAATGELLQTCQGFPFSDAVDWHASGHIGTVTAVDWSPNGKFLASASEDNTVRIWDPIAGKQLHKLKGHTHWVLCVAWSPDGTHLTSGSTDRTIIIWSFVSQQKTLSFHGDTTGTVWSVAWSHDGTRIASTTDNDNAVYVWDALTGECMQCLKGHSNIVRSVSWSPDDLQLVSASEDGTLKIWHAPTHEMFLLTDSHIQLLEKIISSKDIFNLTNTEAEIYESLPDQWQTFLIQAFAQENFT